MTVRPVTPLVQPHGLVLSDKTTYDAWRDDLAVPDPFQVDFEPVYSHGLVLPSEAVAAAYSAATPASTSSPAGRADPATAPEPGLSPARGQAVHFADDRLPLRFWSKARIDRDTGCWVWLASGTVNGYGQIQYQGKQWRAHRVTWDALVGPIPAGYQMDHLCRNRGCVNPAHLEPVTQAENLRRQMAAGSLPPSRLGKRKTHCKHGHEFTPENTYTVVKPSGRTAQACRACRRQREDNRSSAPAASHGGGPVSGASPDVHY